MKLPDHPLVAFVSTELRDEGIPNPSPQALRAYLRTAVIAGRSVELGLHLLPGLERVRVIDARVASMMPGEVVLEVWAPDPEQVRQVLAPWLGSAGELFVIVAVHRPSWRSRWSARLTWWRWLLGAQLWRLRRDGSHVGDGDRSALIDHH
ncbi:MAG: hypothetical protein KC457_00975 [Myxococcales bacterium]|nr:hypothetical protein [Myxococcales bacterium]